MITKEGRCLFAAVRSPGQVDKWTNVHGTRLSWIFLFSKRHEYLTRAKLLLARICHLFSFRMFSGFPITVRNLSGSNCFSARLRMLACEDDHWSHLLAGGCLSRALMLDTALTRASCVPQMVFWLECGPDKCGSEEADFYTGRVFICWYF